MSDQELIIKISATAKQFNTELEKLQKKVEDLDENLSKVAKVSGAAFGVLAGSIAGATIAASNFEKTFSNVVTQLDKTSFSTKTLDQGIEDLRKGVLKLGADSGESFEVLNTGLFELVSAGVPAEKAIEQLTAASNLATAGATDTASAVKALIAAYTSYGEEAGTATEVAQKFFTASKYGVTDVQGLATEFNKIAGLSRTLGISFDEALGSATALTNNGAKPVRQAFTEFEAVLNSVVLAQNKLATASPEVQKALSLENIRAVGLNEALRQVMEATDGNVVAIQKLLGSSQALSGVLSLTGAQAGTVSLILKGLGDEEKRAADFASALALKQETLDKATERLKRSFEQALIILGDQFLPIIKGVTNGITAMAKSFTELSPTMQRVTSIAAIFFTIISGSVATLAIAGKALLAYRNYIAALELAFGVGRIAAIQFWSAVTLGLTAAVALLPTAVAGFKELINTLSGGKKPQTLEEINRELDRLKKLREDINNQTDVNFGDKKGDQLAKVDAQIKALEALKQKQLEVNAVQAGEAAPGAPAPQKQEDGGSNFKDEDTKKRIAAAQAEAEQLRLISEEASKEEQEFAKRRADLRAAEIEANKMMDAEERALTLENIRAKNEALLLEEETYQQNRALVIATAREQQAALDEELKLLGDEKKAELRQADLDALSAQIMTEDQLKNEAAKKDLQRQIDTRNQYNANTLKYGKANADLQKFLNSEEIQGATTAANQLIALQQSKNNTLKSIGKAAALTKIGIDTATGALQAYNAMSVIPIVGPALGIAAAAALIAFGAEQTSRVLAANEGGRVPMAGGGITGVDSVPSMLTPGEFVVPAQNYDEVVNAVADSRAAGSSDGTGGGMTVVIQGDFYGEETFIDKLADNLLKAKNTRNLEY